MVTTENDDYYLEKRRSIDSGSPIPIELHCSKELIEISMAKTSVNIRR